jgi:precorrin-6A/cobalt-precorrin-6A reductase
MMRVLILGGTTEASALARALADDPRVAATLSLAGRTSAPAPQPVPLRVGGFGGADGLADWLRVHRIDVLIDATHPFATRISRNALVAAEAARTKLLVLLRPAWRPVAGDDWRVVPDMDTAAEALGEHPRRVLLTVGRQDLAPFPRTPHRYVLRSVEPPPSALIPANAEIIAARGPFAEEDERALMTAHAIEMLVTKNAGGEATAAKLAAARALRLPVVMVARPAPPDGPHVPTVADALAWLEARHAEAPRGV